MTDRPPGPGAPLSLRRVAWTVDAGIAAFAATTGALLMFANARGSAVAPFAAIGRRVARDIVLPLWGDVTLGLGVHLGQCLALGAATALLLGAAADWRARIRAALVVVFVWELAARVAWLAVVRADVVSGLSTASRAGLAVLMIGALAVGPRGKEKRGGRGGRGIEKGWEVGSG